MAREKSITEKWRDWTLDEPTNLNENIKVISADKITSKIWRNMKYDLRDQIDELVKVGEDYNVFQNAQGTAKSLKQIKRILDRIN